LTSPAVLVVSATGVCTGVVIPDIQMKKPRHFKGLYFVWLLIQVFKGSILRLYLFLYRKVLDMHPEPSDKRLTHSLPGLFFLAGITGCTILFIIFSENFPCRSYPRFNTAFS
jgi:hypothetical protein